MESVAELFIIESLGRDDEKSGRAEGRVIADILNLKGKKAEYIYIRTRRELLAALKEFSKSKFRYLHFSCHGNDKSISTTYDEIFFNEFERIFKKRLKKKRLFFSSCNVVGERLGEDFFVKSKALSILGPVEPIHFDDSVLFWANFYHLMFNINANGMNSKDIKKIAKATANLLNIEIGMLLPNKKNNSDYKMFRTK